MILKRAIGIVPLLGFSFFAACSDVPTATKAAQDSRPGYENGGSYGSGGKAQTGSTAPTNADATITGENGGSYGSGG